ncbi:hypothetical protein AB0C38_44880 [Amycolatopsis sp. NPDC048633]|uniref:hypothetical protein n=1 Tax=Amycolatopsis sp. NPDC048633 TaxID=3157095 RepID=UPI0033F723CD
MGRHARDDEPVPHPEDRAGAPGGRRPHPDEAAGSPRAAGRGEASGAYPVAGQGSSRTSKRSSISAAFGIAGRGAAARGESSGYFVSGGGEPSGSHPAAGRGESSPAARRGEASGTYPVAGRGESSPAARRGEASGTYPVAGRGEPTGSHPAARRGEASGSYPAVGLGEPSGSHPAAGRGEPSPAARRGEASGSYPVVGRGEAPGRRGAAPGAQPGRRGEAGGRRRGKAPAVRPEESAAERTEVITRHGETSGDYPITARNEPAGSPRTLEREAADGEGTSRRGRRRTEAADGETPGRRRVPGRTDTTAPAAKSEATGSHRTLGKGEATGSHRIVGKKAPRRRIAGWPIACAVLAALIGLGVIGWNWADSELNSRAEAQAASCSSGTSHMRILVTPSVQKPLTAAADRWNQAATVVHGQCVHVMIEAKPSAQVLDALVGRTNVDSIGGLPAAWLPESSYWVSELTTKKPELIGSPAQSVANARSADYPFIGLTGQGIDDTVLRAAQTFREYLEQPAQQADFAAAGIKST